MEWSLHVEPCARHFHMCCLPSCSEKHLEGSITTRDLQWECSESKLLDQGWLIKGENWNVDSKSAWRIQCPLYLLCHWTALSSPRESTIWYKLYDFTWVLMSPHGTSGLLQQHCENVPLYPYFLLQWMKQVLWSFFFSFDLYTRTFADYYYYILIYI